jgi:hypothetical protein
MTRLTFLATTAVGITIGLTACNDSPVQPTTAQAAVADQSASFSREGHGGRKGKGGGALRCEDVLPPGNALCTIPSIIQRICAGETGTFTIPLGAFTATVTVTRTNGVTTVGITLAGPGLPGGSIAILVPTPLTPQQLAALCNIGRDCPGDDDDDDDRKSKDRERDSDGRSKGRDR